MRKYTIEEVESCIQKFGYLLVSEKYNGANSKIKLECPKSHLWETTFARFKNSGRRCRECAIIKRYKGGAKACYRRNRSKKLNDVKNYRNSFAFFDTHVFKIDFCEKVRRDPSNLNLLQVRCAETSCRRWFNPTNSQVSSRTKSLNNERSGESKFYCSENCKQTCSIYRQRGFPKGFYNQNQGRDPKVQAEWRVMVLERDEYTCVRCGISEVPLIAHHIEGIKLNPILSADIDNGMTVCVSCDEEIHKEKGCRRIDLTKSNICKGDE